MVVADRGTDVAVAAAVAVGDGRGEATRGVVGHPCCSDTIVVCFNFGCTAGYLY